jgi:diguanylate cyclase (GGDEF)-like protein
MQLDVPTLMAMGSFVGACAGAVLLSAWLQNRNAAVLGIWGLSNIIAAFGIFLLMLGAALHLASRPIIGVILMPLSQGLVWRGARKFDGKTAPLPIVFLGMAAAAIANLAPNLQHIAGAVGPATGVVYMAAVAIGLWLGRADRLPARGPLIVLTTVHAATLMIGTYSFFNRAIGADQVPSVMSLFGLIHFESIIFFVGTAVFLLSLVRERSEAASRAAANVDSLTGIANRSAFWESAERILERCRRDNAPVSVMVFDLDRFKSINDTHGHAVGDDVIKMFCEVALDVLRPNEVFGRIGGEEFAVVIAGAGIEAAAVRADRIRAAFAEAGRFVKGYPVNATVSGGIAMSNNPMGSTLGALLESSDKALYCAKAAGRNRVERAHQSPERETPSVIRIA